VDYTYLGTDGSLGFNAPLGIEHKRGKIVTETFHHARFGKVKSTK